MTESEARQALLLRAFEQPLTPPWSREDAAAADEEAQRQLGSAADAERFIAARAALGMARLLPREPAAATALDATAPRPAWGRGALVLAALAGAFADAAGSAQHINILAPPLLALMLWNLLVYLALALGAVQRLRAQQMAPVPAAAGLRRLALRGWHALQGRWAGAGGATSAPVARYLAAWWQAGRALHAARLATTLHGAAAVFAVAALASLYVRGLGFEYRAGWDSTFLGADAVHRLVGWLFGPAAALTGIALPGPEALAALRFSHGPGENAATWIHLQAVTVTLVVVLPRLALAAAAWRSARRAAADVRLPLHEPDLARLCRLADGSALNVVALPYSFELSPAAQLGLRPVLEAQLGASMVLKLHATVPLGGEDDAAAWAPALAGASTVAALFSLTATPERETHGAFVAALAARLAQGQRLLLLVDEAAFRQRFTGVDGEQRLAQRREAWRRMLAERGREATFVAMAA